METRKSSRVSGSTSSSPVSSSRKPASENSGVRSSCDALAMNSARARSSEASRRRISSNARASWPSSSGPASITASSKRPSAISSAAASSRRIRHQHGAASRRHRGEHGVDIFGGHQRDVRQQSANGFRPLGNQRRSGERNRYVEAARKFLVDSERIGSTRHREQARVRRHHGDVVGGVGAERGGQHVAKHRLGQRTSLTGRQDGRQPGLGEFELLGCDQNKAHGVSL